jgi:nucleotide-binding universal stress UspA family protein
MRVACVPAQLSASLARGRNCRLGEGAAWDMALSFGVASDGSRLSQLAQEFAAGMIKRRGVDDSLSALHITPSPEKLDLVPDHLKPSKLEADVVEFAREQDLDIKWVTQQREVGMSTGDALCKLVQDAGCDFTCVGSYGRKDPDDPDHIGSTGSEPLKYVSLETYSLATHFLTHT